MRTAVLGFPRMGEHRELKFAIERYWRGETDENHLKAAAAAERNKAWRRMHDAGVDFIPCNDDTLYDHVLDTLVMVGGLDERFGSPTELDTYFRAARGPEALDMTKWFDTNYHFLRPDLQEVMDWRLVENRPLERYLEAQKAGIETRPVILGPFTLLYLSRQARGNKWDHMDDLAEVYQCILEQLWKSGCASVQIDEPALVMDDVRKGHYAAEAAYVLTAALRWPGRPEVCLTTYYGTPDFDTLDMLWEGGAIEAVGIDFCADEATLGLWLHYPGLQGVTVEAGLVDGRSVWKERPKYVREKLAMVESLGPGERGPIRLSTSCPLWHLPYTVKIEPRKYPNFAFAVEKVDSLTKILNETAEEEISRDPESWEGWKEFPRPANSNLQRAEYETRRAAQEKVLDLPLLPTTTIGSFPQDRELRELRYKVERGEVSGSYYQAMVRQRIAKWMKLQEEVGLDVLVHGEFERADMVEYFAERLEGMVTFKHAWVQSYGQRMVRPPAVVGPVRWKGPITVDIWRAAQQWTAKPVKGILTGPTTMLKWSFPQVGVPLAMQRQSIAQALRQEVEALVGALCHIIQIDEPAIREAYPLSAVDRKVYECSAVGCWMYVAAACPPEVQVHSHFCYSDFEEVGHLIEAIDADVITMESTRSGDASILDDYPRQIGPGVYDVHSPHIPEVDDVVSKIWAALEEYASRQLWVNPDCGLKTRREEEAVPSLRNMVEAAQLVRAKLGDTH